MENNNPTKTNMEAKSNDTGMLDLINIPDQGMHMDTDEPQEVVISSNNPENPDSQPNNQAEDAKHKEPGRYWRNSKRTDEKPHRRFRTLYQLVPKGQFWLAIDTKTRRCATGSFECDIRILSALHVAVGNKRPRPREAACLLEKLFARVVHHLQERLYLNRAAFWEHVTKGWRKDAGVVLDVADVRTLVLALTLGERRYSKERLGKPRPLLYYVPRTNFFLRWYEQDSDEAVEILVENKMRETAPSGFVMPSTVRIPWQTSPMESTNQVIAPYMAPLGLEVSTKQDDNKQGDNEEIEHTKEGMVEKTDGRDLGEITLRFKKDQPDAQASSSRNDDNIKQATIDRMAHKALVTNLKRPITATSTDENEQSSKRQKLKAHQLA